MVLAHFVRAAKAGNGLLPYNRGLSGLSPRLSSYFSFGLGSINLLYVGLSSLVSLFLFCLFFLPPSSCALYFVAVLFLVGLVRCYLGHVVLLVFCVVNCGVARGRFSTYLFLFCSISTSVAPIVLGGGAFPNSRITLLVTIPLMHRNN